MKKIISLISNFIFNIFNEKKYLVVIYFIIGAVIFTFFFRPEPLYVDNQHTKFLHGFAQAGYGHLKNDWTANTIDPLPVFSFLVFVTYKFLHEYFFYIYYIIVLGFFIFSILKIIVQTFNMNDPKKNRLLILASFLALMMLHSDFFRAVSGKLFGFNLNTWLMERGVADQYLLGRYFQPCQMGVLLLVSIYFFIKNKPYLASFFVALASVFHSTYLLLSGILTITYLFIILKDEKNIKKAFYTGFIAFIIVLPVLVYNFIYLGPSSNAASKESLDLIVNYRIPQHTNPWRWLGINTFFRMSLIIIASAILYLNKKKKLFYIIVVPFLITVFLTVLDLFIHSDFIGFLTPWRTSALLTPLSTSIIIGAVSYLIIKKFNMFFIKNYNILQMFFVIVLVLLISYEALKIKEPFSMYLGIKRTPLEEYVYKNNLPKDVYLIPISLADFRLNTGVPVLVTRKSHPYKDVEVIEWYNRIKMAEAFYSSENKAIKGEIENLKTRYNVTHIVISSGENSRYKNIEGLNEIYNDSNYSLYKIKY